MFRIKKNIDIIIKKSYHSWFNYLKRYYYVELVRFRLEALDIGEMETIDSCSVSRSISKQHILTRLHLDAYPSLQQRARRPEMNSDTKFGFSTKSWLIEVVVPLLESWKKSMKKNMVAYPLYVL